MNKAQLSAVAQKKIKQKPAAQSFEFGAAGF